jgi:hypothetical protein
MKMAPVPSGFYKSSVIIYVGNSRQFDVLVYFNAGRNFDIR